MFVIVNGNDCSDSYETITFGLCPVSSLTYLIGAPSTKLSYTVSSNGTKCNNADIEYDWCSDNISNSNSIFSK